MLYLMKFEKGSEVFYKVGRSFCPETRLKSFKDYKVELLWNSPRGFNCDKLEHFFHKDNKKRSYTPAHSFNGSSECYTFLTPAFMRSYCKTNIHLVSTYTTGLSFNCLLQLTGKLFKWDSSLFKKAN